MTEFVTEQRVNADKCPKHGTVFMAYCCDRGKRVCTFDGCDWEGPASREEDRLLPKYQSECW